MSLIPAPSEWTPLEEQFHTWDIVLRNPPIYVPGSGTAGRWLPGGDYLGPDWVVPTKVLSLWASISITETHEGIRTQIEVNAEEPAIPFIKELVTDFVFYRDRELRYRLRCVDSEDVLTRDAATVKFDCVSYDKLLERRILHEDWLLDDGDINAAWRLIDYTQRRYGLGITRGTKNMGSRRQRSLDAGDDILTAINDFAQADGGFDWWIDADLRFWAVKPQRGKTHTVQWQLGGEVAEMTRLNPIEDYASLVMATGANSEVRIPRPDGEEDVYPPPNPQIVELSSKPLGLWELTTSDTDVITPASLLEKARWHLGDKGSIRPSYKVMLEPGVWQPMFGIGDIVQLRINTVRANVKVPIRIEELQITCTSDGAESVSMAVRAQKPETPIVAGGEEPLPTLLAPGDAPEANGRTVARHRLSEADDLGALLRSLRKRLDRAERSRGMGGGAGANILDGIGPPPPMVGSPGDYYVDTRGQQLYGPKEQGDFQYGPVTTWQTQPANSLRYDEECSIIIYADASFTITGFRYGGHPDASDELTVTFWDQFTKEVIYKTTVPGTGSAGETIEIPPIVVERALTYQQNYVVSIGGAAVPVHAPGGTYPTNVPSYISMVSPNGLYTAPLGQREVNWKGTVATLDLQLVTRSGAAVVLSSESCVPVPSKYQANKNISGEVGHLWGVRTYITPARLLGWRYRRMADSDSPMTWRVWRTISVGASNSTPPLGEVLATVVTDHTGEGEFEVRLPTPILLDPTGMNAPQGATIAAGGIKVPIYDREIQGGEYPLPDYYDYEITPAMNDTVGELPYHGVPGLPEGAWTGAFLVFPIMQEERELWPLANIARSDNPPQPRAELRRKPDFTDADWTPDDGLHFYQGGPSHPFHNYGPEVSSTAAGGDGVESDIPWWDVILHYEGNSGVELIPNSWYYTYSRKRPGDDDYTAGWMSRVSAWYAWYWDYAYQEQDADLDNWDPYFPGSYFMTYSEQSTWNDIAYYSYQTIGPNYGGGHYVDGEQQSTTHDGGAGFGAEVVEIGNEPFVETVAEARIWVIGDDGVSGTSLTVTPRVIQASFPPSVGSGHSWWNPGYIPGLTPKGCVVPLITAASATATAADEPWQKQFFRQMGSNLVSFISGVGQIGVPTGMALPAVVNAQVEGVAVGGVRVAQAARTGDYLITVALDSAHTGDVLIGWSVEHAVLTFGTPPPAIDFFRNPGSTYLYGPTVDYDPAGGTWEFEIVSTAGTFVEGCIMKDFTGATVGGPFTIAAGNFVVGDPVTAAWPRADFLYWSAGRDWYLPGEEQQYRVVNPDLQVSNWQVLRWVDEVGLRAAKESTLKSPRRMQSLGVTPDMIDPADKDLVVQPDVSNNPRMRPAADINPLNRNASPLPKDARKVGGPQNRQAQKEWVAEQQALRRRANQSPEPPPTQE